ncbi:MAG: polysaccharide biosynthesis tyrosine autokinase [Phycisphaeraceae bacterium]
MRDDYNTAADDPFSEIEQTESSARRMVLLNLLRGRWHWAILLSTVLAAAGGYLGYNSQNPEYQTWSKITIKPDYILSVNVKDLTLYEEYTNFVRGEVSRLTSSEVIAEAMQKPEWQDAVREAGEEYASMSVDEFEDSLSVFMPEADEQDVIWGFSSENPLIAQAGVNTLLEAYREERKASTTAQIDDNTQLLIDRRQELERKERLINERKRLVIPDDEYLMIKTRLSSKLGELANMEFKLSELDLILDPFLKAGENGEDLPLEELMLQDPEMQALLEQKEELQEDYAFLTEELGRGETMPDVVRVRRLLNRIDRQIVDLEAVWLAKDAEAERPLPDGVMDLLAQRDALLLKIQDLQALTNDMASRIAAVEEEEYELAQVRDALRDINDEIEQFGVTGSLLARNEDVTRVIIGDPVDLPRTPYNSGKRNQLAGIGGMCGFGTGFGLVMLIGLFDRRLRHVSDTASDLPDANVLGILPTLPADLKNPEEAETAAHCVHHIRTLLQIGGSNRVFSVTSPEAGSGKSSLATALGMSFATAGSRTLVIDADLVGAGLSRRMGAVVHESLDNVIRQRGMMDEAELARAQTLATSQNAPLEEVLLRENLMSEEQLDTAKRLQLDTSLGLLNACVPGRLRSCVASTEIDNFFIVPVGKARPSDASRLSPAAIRELVRQARESFDIVLVDTGPVLGSLEASIVAAESDATVLIVSRGDQRSIATRSLEQLRSVRAQIAGVVFNHALDSDLAHTSYASLVSQERRPDRSTRARKLDKTRSARLGPLGTAVASYTDDEPDARNGHAVSTNGDRNGYDHAD